MDKLQWSGVVTGIQPRIRLTRSYDERMHSYLGYVLRVDGECGSSAGEFTLGLGTVTYQKHGLRLGDRVAGLAVASPSTEPAEFYKVSKLQRLERGKAAVPHAPPWRGRGPDLETYRRRGHRRLDARTYTARCSTCMWGARMAVEIILDKWNPVRRKYRSETFCYGPRSCAFYRAGRTRSVPWKGGPAWEEPDWLDDELTSHRHPDE